MKKLFDMYLVQENDIEMGETYDGEMLISAADRGVFEGEELQGEVIPMGMGVTYTPKPGRNDIKTSMLLRMCNGAYVYMQMEAFFDIDSQDERKLAGGGFVPSYLYYFKGTVSFKTGAAEYKWMERRICVCEAEVISWERLKVEVYMI